MTASINLTKKGFVRSAVVALLLSVQTLFAASSAKAQTTNSPRVYKLDITYGKLWHNSEPLLPEIGNKQWGDAATLESGVSAGKYYLETLVHMESAFGKIMVAGLAFSTGFQINKYFSVEYGHHSWHVLDSVNAYANAEDRQERPSITSYGLRDTIGVRVSFVPDERKNK